MTATITAAVNHFRSIKDLHDTDAAAMASTLAKYPSLTEHDVVEGLNTKSQPMATLRLFVAVCHPIGEDNEATFALVARSQGALEAKLLAEWPNWDTDEPYANTEELLASETLAVNWEEHDLA